jgi:hypothetical protein
MSAEAVRAKVAALRAAYDELAALPIDALTTSEQNPAPASVIGVSNRAEAVLVRKIFVHLGSWQYRARRRPSPAVRGHETTGAGGQFHCAAKVFTTASQEEEDAGGMNHRSLGTEAGSSRVLLAPIRQDPRDRPWNGGPERLTGIEGINCAGVDAKSSVSFI